MVTPDPKAPDEPAVAQQLRDLPIDSIVPNPDQPRRHFDEATLQTLAGSIGERGVLQPVLVRARQDGKFEITAGERRWRAAQIAGLERIPALVSPYDNTAALEVAVIENMAREDLNPVEQARACAMLADEVGLSHRQIGIRVGRHMSVVSNLIRLLGLSDEILGLMEGGQLSAGHGRALLMAKNLQTRSQLARSTVEEGWSVRALENRARASNMDVPHSRQSLKEQDADPAQAQDMVALNVAKVWGDVVGAEVHVRNMPYRKVRVEVSFDTSEGALALGQQLAEVVVRGRRAKRP
jgi:ParB family transcriptional regulator, chromosome partitioning protein